jgi:hypothetical protein
MAVIVTRSGKGSPLTNAEVDSNFTNLNTELSEKLATITAASTYQPILVSGTSIKTVNGTSILGSGNIQIDGGVTSFNTRTGAVTLSSTDITTALTYTPANKAGDTFTGNVSAPKFVPTFISPAATAGTGMYLPANNNLAFSTNGVERFRVNAAGNFGIGRDNPLAMLDVGGQILIGPVTSGVSSKFGVNGNSLVEPNVIDFYSDYGTRFPRFSFGKLGANMHTWGFQSLPSTGAATFRIDLGHSNSATAITVLEVTTTSQTVGNVHIPNGSLGIGTTNLTSRLTVAGTIESTTGGVKYPDGTTQTTAATGTNTGDQTITLTGDVTGSGTGSFATTLANSGVTAGTYTKVTVDAKGRVTTGASLASGDLPTYTGAITSSQVTTALGFTPYNSTNPSGYVSIDDAIAMAIALG